VICKLFSKKKLGFSKHFQICRFFSPSISKDSFGGFEPFQGVTGRKKPFSAIPNFFPDPRRSRVNPTASTDPLDKGDVPKICFARPASPALLRPPCFINAGTLAHISLFRNIFFRNFTGGTKPTRAQIALAVG
jgi:hypothetical protein